MSEKKNVPANTADQTAETEQESPNFTAIEAKMAEMRGEKVKSDETESPAEDVKTPAEEVKTPADEPVKTDDSQSGDETPVKKDDLPLLPAGHRRAAIGRGGYSDEEIDYLLERDPELILARAAEIYGDWQDENAKYSAAGRRLAATGQTAGEHAKVASEAAKESVLSPLDIAALVEEHGNEALIKVIVDPINRVIERLNAVAGKLSESENFLKSTEEDSLRGVIQEFLTSADMKPFVDTYGTMDGDLTDVQTKSQMDLFQHADIISAGARDHGVDITPREDLERANLGSRDQVIRDGIRDAMKKRTKTLPSSHEQSPPSGEAQEVTEDELVRRVDARMQAIRNK